MCVEFRDLKWHREENLQALIKLLIKLKITLVCVDEPRDSQQREELQELEDKSTVTPLTITNPNILCMKSIVIY